MAFKFSFDVTNPNDAIIAQAMLQTYLQMTNGDSNDSSTLITNSAVTAPKQAITANKAQITNNTPKSETANKAQITNNTPKSETANKPKVVNTPKSETANKPKVVNTPKSETANKPIIHNNPNLSISNKCKYLCSSIIKSGNAVQNMKLIGSICKSNGAKNGFFREIPKDNLDKFLQDLYTNYPKLKDISDDVIIAEIAKKKA